ncbi:MAG: TonB-dependent copper receptor [Spongiibacteraceae bacterium]
MKKHILLTAVAMTPVLSLANHDLAIELVEVTAERDQALTTQQVFSDAPLTRPVHDAGELLRSVTGMSATRRGGRGFEPIIRGQSQNRLNIISDGAFNYGACPGRMDPPTTYVGFDSFDQVSVIKGNRSVIYGAGGSGGTLLFEHQRPEFGDSAYLGNMSLGYTGNSDLRSVAVDVAAGNQQGFVRVFGERVQSDNYDDGAGNTVSSSFDSNSYGVIVGGDIQDHYLEISHEVANEEDLWYAGNGMDAPYADSTTSRFKWDYNGAIGPVDTLSLNLYRSDVIHLMDNYSLRARNAMPNGMAAPSSSDTWGGRFMATINGESSEWRIGVDHRANDRKADLYMDAGKDGSYELLASRMWPSVEQRQTGLFAEMDYQLSSADTLRTGMRFDRFRSTATASEEPAGMMGAATPGDLYQANYGTRDSSNNTNDVGLVLGWDHQLNTAVLFSGNLSRSVRHPDASENFIARSAMGKSWVGNPNIDAEIHQQLDLTVLSRQGEKHWSANVYWDEVDDYIERYNSGTATLYRNINARLRGVELEVGQPLLGALSGRVGVAYTEGDGDNGDLAYISPLQATFYLDYQGDKWAVGAQWVVADRQNRIDEDNDVPEETAGFGVLNIYGNWNVTEALVLETGVENVADKNYAYHVNTASSDPFDPTAVRVNEPGRQYWVKARYRF